MGYVQSGPVVVDEGIVTLRYVNGEKCHVGTPNESRRSTRITFTCSPEEVCILSYL